MNRRKAPRTCCWCGVRMPGHRATREHLQPRAQRLSWHRADLGPKTMHACGPCNWSRGNTLGPPPTERASFGPPPGGFGGIAGRAWRDGMAWWVTAALARPMEAL